MNVPQELETLYKIRIWHDGSRPFAGWHLDKVFITNPVSGERYDFSCQNWLASDEGDGEIIRELPATAESIKEPGMVKDYEVLVKTGNEFGSGTDANVFINIFGSKASFQYFLSNVFVNFFVKIFCQNFLSKFFSQNFLSNFFLKIFCQIFFSKFFCQNFFGQDFFVKIFLVIYCLNFFVKFFCQNF